MMMHLLVFAGWSLSITPDGSTIAIGFSGSAWVFKSNGTSYDQVGDFLEVVNDPKASSKYTEFFALGPSCRVVLAC